MPHNALTIRVECPGPSGVHIEPARHVQAAKGVTQLRLIVLAGRAAAIAGCTVGQQMKLLVDALDYMQVIEDGERASDRAQLYELNMPVESGSSVCMASRCEVTG